ncbi:TetR/AcrR family transcriptional regulator [Pseudomonas sp.]|uniref:TetR/AcrR family transcriptional regulator n=1 Tax=Pseudomonas sp. TaxID=306 RepID=UPI00272B77B1|nr:TetR/AcrR family transcriptional regulator [Pseudomonas sp.]
MSKTRERILDASLELFNRQGERSITTNHIAAHLQMSPGNLYYHFRNKQQIIAELFAAYEAQIELSLSLPQDRALTVEDKRHYLESLVGCLWNYRFLHRDLEHLLSCDSQLSEDYRAFSRRCVERGRAIYAGLVSAGILCPERTVPEALAVNAWLILTGWVGYLCTSVLDSAQDELTRPMLRQGVYQVLALELGLVSEAARGEVQALLADYLRAE